MACLIWYHTNLRRHGIYASISAWSRWTQSMMTTLYTAHASYVKRKVSMQPDTSSLQSVIRKPNAKTCFKALDDMLHIYIYILFHSGIQKGRQPTSWRSPGKTCHAMRTRMRSRLARMPTPQIKGKASGVQDWERHKSLNLKSKYVSHSENRARNTRRRRDNLYGPLSIDVLFIALWASACSSYILDGHGSTSDSGYILAAASAPARPARVIAMLCSYTSAFNGKQYSFDFLLAKYTHWWIYTWKTRAL